MSNTASLIFYLVSFTASAIFLSKSNYKNRKNTDLFFLIAIILPVLVAALRYEVGTDYRNYIIMYQDNKELSLAEFLDPDYDQGGSTFGVWLMSRIAGLFNSPSVYLGGFALVIILSVSVVLKSEYDKEVCFLAFLGFLLSNFTNSFNITKQAIAVSILLVSFKYVYKREFFKFIILIIIATLFHKTAIVGLVYYFLYNPQPEIISFKKIGIIVVCIFCVVFSSELLMLMGDRFDGYANSQGDFANKSLYLDAAWVLVYYIFRKQYVKLDSRNDFLITLALIGVIMGFTGFYSQSVKRIAAYFNVGGFLLKAQLPLLFKDSEKMIVKMLMFAYIVFMFIYSYFVLGFSDVFPYNFIQGDVLYD